MAAAAAGAAPAGAEGGHPVAQDHENFEGFNELEELEDLEEGVAEQSAAGGGFGVKVVEQSQAIRQHLAEQLSSFREGFETQVTWGLTRVFSSAGTPQAWGRELSQRAGLAGLADLAGSAAGAAAGATAGAAAGAALGGAGRAGESAAAQVAEEEEKDAASWANAAAALARMRETFLWSSTRGQDCLAVPAPSLPEPADEANSAASAAGPAGTGAPPAGGGPASASSASRPAGGEAPPLLGSLRASLADLGWQTAVALADDGPVPGKAPAKKNRRQRKPRPADEEVFDRVRVRAKLRLPDGRVVACAVRTNETRKQAVASFAREHGLDKAVEGPLRALLKQTLASAEQFPAEVEADYWTLCDAEH